MTDQVFFYLPSQVLKTGRILKNGRKFPMISFGTSEINKYENVYTAVNAALETGYRAFDCSPKDRQEEYLGTALKELLPKYNLKREDVLLCTKLHPKDYGLDYAVDAFRRSCINLQTDYIDLYLMQWPGGYNLKCENEENLYLRQETWKELLKLQWHDYIKNVGVCHFTVKQLESLRECTGLLPSVNQVEFHPRCQQIELFEFCKDNGILLQAHSFRDTLHPITSSDPVVMEISKNLKKTPTQIVLKWILNREVAVISQSASPIKIKQNFQLYDFALDKSNMDMLNASEIREKYLPSTICIV